MPAKSLTESGCYSFLLPMIFDTVIYAFAAFAIIMGFSSGLLRSLATIFGYLIAAPLAVAVAPALSMFLAQRMDMPAAYNGVVLAFTLLVAGMVFGALLRRAVGDVTGPQIGMWIASRARCLAPAASLCSPC